jgi:hypothetical protein
VVLAAEDHHPWPLTAHGLLEDHGRRTKADIEFLTGLVGHRRPEGIVDPLSRDVELKALHVNDLWVHTDRDQWCPRIPHGMDQLARRRRQPRDPLAYGCRSGGGW